MPVTLIITAINIRKTLQRLIILITNGKLFAGNTEKEKRKRSIYFTSRRCLQEFVTSNLLVDYITPFLFSFAVKKCISATLSTFNSCIMWLRRLSVACKASRSASTVAYSWGSGAKGELGHARFQTSSTLTGESYLQMEPRRIKNSKRFKTFAVGVHYSLAIDSEGKLFHWGEGPFKSVSSHEPVPLPIEGAAARFTDISVGKSHAAAVDEEGSVFTWGSNGSWMGGGGYLGHGDTLSLSSPKKVAFMAEYGAKIAQAVCGGRHTVFRSFDGELLSCGVGEYGRLGVGSTFDALVPTPLDSLIEEDIVQVAAGSSHTLALAKSGSLYVWGRNDYGKKII